MSLPDTIFIFVLALIIFGPKKLPEIGRQVGKLVGEFRRASNEFKFQIEEELRQADILEKYPRTEQTIASPAADPEVAEALQPPVLPEFSGDQANLPVGQYPNIDMLNTAGLNGANEDFSESSADDWTLPEEEPAPLAIVPVKGSEPRMSPPFAYVPPASENPAVEPPAEPIPDPAETEKIHG